MSAVAKSQAECLGGRGDCVSAVLFPTSVPTMENQEGSQKLTVADVLLEIGCWVTRRDARQKAGETVESWGFSGEQVAPLLRHIVAMAGTPQIGAGEVVNLLKDRERLTAAVQDWGVRAKANEKTAPLAPGESIRVQNLERMRRQEAEWQRYEDDLKAGRVERLPRLVMPWERKTTN